MKANKMAYARASKGSVLAQVIAEINKSATKPLPGYLKLHDWAKKWNLTKTQTALYVDRAVASGILVVKSYRVITNGRLRMLRHYGPPQNKPLPRKRKRG